MYMIESMIEMGLEKGQKWPSPAHKTVACNLALCNPLVKNRDNLAEIVQKVCKIPKDEIKTITMAGLAKYGLSFVCAE